VIVDSHISWLRVIGTEAGDRGLSLIRVPLEGGRAEALPGFRPAQPEGGAEWIYGLWADGSGMFFVNTGGTVVLLDEAGSVQAAPEGLQLHSKRFVPLSDGRVGIPAAIQSPEGAVSQPRLIDTAPGPAPWTAPLPPSRAGWGCT